ncbi:MAG: hypothetical protein A2Z02_00960 [Chloroflexi bacterium RBG_16_48_7]|nr:MAG: hypothetical protein A2Z02_00960 [Chloroflexi bacterium RBG_16_48_7]
MHKGAEQISRGNPQGTGELAANEEHREKVDRIREILFGAQREEYDKKFSRLEELLVKNIANLNNEMTEKLGALRDEYDKRFSRLEELPAKNVTGVNNDLQDLHDKKVDKAAISKYLEVILKLSNELDTSRADKLRHE